MSDHESPGFTVVDRRQSVTESGADERHLAPENSVLGTSTDTSTVVNEMADTSVNSSPPYDQDLEGAEDRSLPDPSILLSIAAMQMDIRTLALAMLAVFDGHAWRAMGFLADPKTGETTKDLSSAQLAIDCVQFFLGKLENGMGDTERREIQRRLTDLRMNYVNKLREGER
jgi:hypothetical protein